MERKLLTVALSLFFIGFSILGANGQSNAPIPVLLSVQSVCREALINVNVSMAMDAAKNKFFLCTENHNGRDGVDIAFRVVKLNTSTTQVLYSTLINLGNFLSSDLAVSPDGTAFVLLGNGITRISPDGTIVEINWRSVNLYEGKSIIVDSQNNLFVAGQLNNDAAIVKILSDGSTSFIQSFGGSNYDIANAMVLDSSQTVSVTGRTDSTNFPTIAAFQSNSGGGTDAFLVRLNSNNGTILSSTYLGGNGFDEGRAIAIGATGNSVVVGETDSSNFPTLNGIQSVPGGQRDGFVSKFNNSAASLIFSTFLGGSADDRVAGIALDTNENASVTGITFSNNFPLFRSQKDVLEGNWQAFLTRLNTNGSSFIFSTYQSGGANEFHNGFDIIDDALGGLFLSVDAHSYQGGGDSGKVWVFSPHQVILLYDPTKPFKPNPLIKIQLQDLNSVNNSSTSLIVTSAYVSPRNNIATVLKSLGGNFTFDSKLKFGASVSGGYQYTLDRSGLGAGNYDLVFTVGNETALRVVPFSLK